MASTAEFTCANKRCAKLFTARLADRKRGWARFCNKSCKAIVQEARTGQYAGFLSRQSDDGAGDWEGGGWDAHKDSF